MCDSYDGERPMLLQLQTWLFAGFRNRNILHTAQIKSETQQPFCAYQASHVSVNCGKVCKIAQKAIFNKLPLRFRIMPTENNTGYNGIRMAQLKCQPSFSSISWQWRGWKSGSEVLLLHGSFGLGRCQMSWKQIWICCIFWTVVLILHQNVVVTWTPTRKGCDAWERGPKSWRCPTLNATEARAGAEATCSRQIRCWRRPSPCLQVSESVRTSYRSSSVNQLLFQIIYLLDRYRHNNSGKAQFGSCFDVSPISSNLRKGNSPSVSALWSQNFDL